jgi:predicted permease
VLWATIGLALACGLAAGIIPALQYSRPELTRDLKDGGRGSVSSRSRLRDGLVIAQAALSVALIVGAALMVRTARNVESLDLGYDVAHVVYGGPAYDGIAPPPIADRAATARDLVETLRTRPSIEAAGRTAIPPMSGMSFLNFWWGADSSQSLKRKTPTSYAVTSQFFPAIGIRLVRGSYFDDGAAGEGQVMLNEELAQTLWPNGDAVGQCMRFNKSDAPCTIVRGVVTNARRNDIIEQAMPMVYVPIGTTLSRGDNAIYMIARARRGAVDAARAEMTAMIKAAYPGATPRVFLMATQLEPRYRPYRLGAQLFAGVGVLALIVALVGIYSTMSYSVGQRSHEFGVRTALGAKLTDVLNQVVGEGVRVVAIGIGGGIVISLGAGRLISSLLYGVEPNDISALILAGSTLLLVAIAAAIMPAWRAARTDPVQVLRGD